MTSKEGFRTGETPEVIYETHKSFQGGELIQSLTNKETGHTRQLKCGSTFKGKREYT